MASSAWTRVASPPEPSSLAWLPIPTLLVVVAALWAAHLRAEHSWPLLALALGVFAWVVVPVLVAWVAGRSFLSDGAPAGLLLAGAVAIWGASGLAGAATRDVDPGVTVGSLGVWLAGACSLAAALLSLRSRARVGRRRGAWLVLAAAIVVCIVGAILLAATRGLPPTLLGFGPGNGPARNALFGSAVGMFAVAALLSRTGRVPTPFVHWTSLAELLIAVALIGEILDSPRDAALDWVSRGAQYLAGVYLLTAAVIRARDASRPASRTEVDAARHRCVVALTIVLAATALQLLLVRVAGAQSPFTVYVPAVMLAALYGGRRSGLAASMLSALACLWVGSVAAPTAGGPADWLALAVFLLCGAIISFLTEAMQRAQASASTAAAAVGRAAERQEAQQALCDSEQRYAAIHDRAPFAMALTRPDGRVVSANDAFLRVFECERAEVVGRSLNLLPDADSRERAARELRERGSVRDLECTRIRKSGEPSVLSVNMDWMALGEGELVLTTIYDVSGRKRAERALAEANTRLVDADRRKNEFLAMLSHELRNPLAPIRNGLYVLAHAAPGGEQARRAEAVIGRQLGHLSRIVDDLLDVTRLSRNKIRLEREPLALADLVRRSIEDHRSLFEGNEIALEVEIASEPVMVNGDRTRLAQVVGNLLQNTLKFTAPGGRARVSLAVERPAGQAVFRVADTGIGIASGLLERLFEPFTQAETSLDRNRGGLGLGLSLVKGIVELHGGEVVAASEGPGRGAEFVVRLPLLVGEAAAAERERPAIVPSARRVLIVEDDVDAADSLSEALSICGHAVSVTHDGGEALAAARGFRPDVVLCDIGLPGMDGYEVARAMRAEPALSGVLLVAVSGYAMPEDVQRAIEAGFERHLVKPVSVETLDALFALRPPSSA